MKYASGVRRHPARQVRLLFLVLTAVTTVAQAQVSGDVNCDGRANADDPPALLAGIFGDPPSSCATADVNADGVLTAADLVALINALAPPPGPQVTFFGLAGADGVPTNPLGSLNGTPVFFRSVGFGFQVVVEGRSGTSAQAPGLVTFNFAANDPTRRPDLQIESSAALGDGSLAICAGGVPAVVPRDFGPSQFVANALNDLACNFVSTTTPRSACTQDAFGVSNFVGRGTQVQFCGPVSQKLSFPSGDTTLSVRLRDAGGNLGPVRQLIVRVAPGPMPPTFTASPTIAATSTGTATASPGPKASPSGTPTPPVVPTTPAPTATLTGTAATSTSSRTPTSPLPPSATPSGSRTATPAVVSTTPPPPPFTPTPTRTMPVPPTSTHTPTPTVQTATPTVPRSPTAPPPLSSTPSPTRTATPSASLTASFSPTSSRTPTPTRTASSTPKPTPTPTPTATPSVTPTGPRGPVITFFGVTRADDTLVPPSGTTADGTAIYSRPTGSGFSLVVEGKPGPDRAAVGNSAYQSDLSSFPDLQVFVSNPLGNGSPAVCDVSGPMAGGVPAINPPSFDPTMLNIDTVNDLTCRFLDGTGAPLGRSASDSCVLFANGSFLFAGAGSTIQFCGYISKIAAFPAGDTLVTARLRDVTGNVGIPAQIVVHVGP